MRAYLAAPEREAELESELAHSGARVLSQHERLVVTEGGPRHAAWASTVWLEPEFIEFTSISDAVSRLLERGERWALYSQAHHRRAALIDQGLAKKGGVTNVEPLRFGDRPRTESFGGFALLEPGKLLCSPRTTSAFPHGEVEFAEDRAPPSRAYLKLWELFTLTGRQPKKGELCLDLGSSPGGWTWVLSTLGARVHSVDKAPLDPSVAKLRGVRHEQASAFSIDPSAHEPVDWLFSDVICYPERLCDYVERWLALGKAKNLVCTLKFQGATDHDVARRFARIKGSRLQHLHHNKHELTWWRFA